MRLLANENIPWVAIEALRARGHDVAWVRADAPGSSDRDVLSSAVSEGRILIAFDKDFGELAVRAGLPASSEIILFRVTPHSPTDVARLVVAAVESRSEWAGLFAVVEEGRIRTRPL